jgi:hypothetical protein
LHDDGRALLSGMIRSRLVNRAQLYHWHRRHPEIANEEIPAPDRGAYLGFHLVNYWLQSLDFVGRTTSCNNLQAHVSGDGVIRYVLAHDDPEVPNWMDVGGHPWGGMLFRAALMTEAAQPTARLVPFSEVRDLLPTDTPVIDAAARGEEIRTRRAHIASRFRW